MIQKDVFAKAHGLIFVIKDRQIISPPTENILEGVTRKAILSVIKKNGYDYIEENIPLDSIKNFDGAFLSSTSTKNYSDTKNR